MIKRADLIRTVPKCRCTPRRRWRPLFGKLLKSGGDDETRTRDLCRDSSNRDNGSNEKE
jgi:hypothetical protein